MPDNVLAARVNASPSTQQAHRQICAQGSHNDRLGTIALAKAVNNQALQLVPAVKLENFRALFFGRERLGALTMPW
jgi:hypothetical protein